MLIFKPFAPKFESWDYLMLALIFIVVGIARLIILDANIGYFECAECHERFIASVKDYTFGLHTLKKISIKINKTKRFAERYLKLLQEKGYTKRNVSDKNGY